MQSVAVVTLCVIFLTSVVSSTDDTTTEFNLDPVLQQRNFRRDVKWNRKEPIANDHALSLVDPSLWNSSIQFTDPVTAK